MKRFSKTINYRGQELFVEFDYTPGDPGVHTYPDGDPGYPPTSPEFNIIHVWWDTEDVNEDEVTIDIAPLMEEEDFMNIENAISEI